jgi:hypothetical protein
MNENFFGLTVEQKEPKELSSRIAKEEIDGDVAKIVNDWHDEFCETSGKMAKSFGANAEKGALIFTLLISRTRPCDVEDGNLNRETKDDFRTGTDNISREPAALRINDWLPLFPLFALSRSAVKGTYLLKEMGK